MILASPPLILLTLSLSLRLSILSVPFITISIVALVQLDPIVGKCHVVFVRLFGILLIP